MQQTTRERMAKRLIDVVHECDVGMRHGIGYYRTAIAKHANLVAAGAPQIEIDAAYTEAFNLLRRAVRLPYRVEARAQALIDKHDAATVNAALALVSSYTLANLNAELAPLKVYSDTLKDHYQIDGWTLDQIADDIELNASNLDPDEAVLSPITYVDDM